MPCGGENQAPCGGPVPRAAADCGCTQPVQGACTASTWVTGPWRYTQDTTGCVTREAVGTAIEDGVYANPTITMQDGFVVAITPGESLRVTPPALCGASQVAVTPGSVPLMDGSSCNLSTVVNSRVLTRLFTETAPGSALSITGCGTEASPLVFDVALPADAGGATFQSCGINIQAGRVVAFAAPIMAVTTAPGSGLTATLDTNTCTLTLDVDDPVGSAARLPAIVCDNSVNPTNGVLVGTASTVYELRLPNTLTVVYTATTDGVGAATISNMLTGVYEVVVGTTSLGYVSYTRCAYVAP